MKSSRFVFLYVRDGGKKNTWKVVMGRLLLAPAVGPDPPMAAVIAELMDGPRELITWRGIGIQDGL